MKPKEIIACKKCKNYDGYGYAHYKKKDEPTWDSFYIHKCLKLKKITYKNHWLTGRKTKYTTYFNCASDKNKNSDCELFELKYSFLKKCIDFINKIVLRRNDEN